MNPENETMVPDLSGVEKMKDAVSDSTLALDTSQVEQISDVDSQQVVRPQIQLTPERFMKQVRKWLKDETITKVQANELRQKFGISKNYFTKSKNIKAKAKHKKEIATASRRRNRYNGSSIGQKSVAGY